MSIQAIRSSLPWLQQKHIADAVGVSVGVLQRAEADPDFVGKGTPYNNSKTICFAFVAYIGTIKLPRNTENSVRNWLNEWQDKGLVKVEIMCRIVNLQPSQVSRWKRNDPTRKLSKESITKLYTEIRKLSAIRDYLPQPQKA